MVARAEMVAAQGKTRERGANGDVGSRTQNGWTPIGKGSIWHLVCQGGAELRGLADTQPTREVGAC